MSLYDKWPNAKERQFKDCMNDARWHHEWSQKLQGSAACHHQRMSAILYSEARQLRDKLYESNCK